MIKIPDVTIDLFFEFKKVRIKLPVNPSELVISSPGNNENKEIVGLGEINIIRTPRLRPISINSFFPEDDYPMKYVAFFQEVQASGKPMKFVCPAFPINLDVSIDGFETAMRAGEEGDRYYTLELQEWKDYSPRLIKEEKVIQTNGAKQEEKPEESRVEDPPPPPTTYTVQKGDSLYKISKQYTNKGENWGKLYEANKDLVGKNPSLIYPGQVFIIPSDWQVG